MNNNNVLILSSMRGTFQVIFIIVIFAVMLFAAYYTTRFVGNISIKRSANSNMQIIEVLPVGPQKTLQLVKIGNQYHLIGVTKDQITYITKVEQDTLELSKGLEANPNSFKKIFEDFSKKNKG